MALVTYCPEMKETKPVAAFEARLNYDSSYQVRTRNQFRLEALRGVRFIRTLTASDLIPQAQHKVGMREYRLTKRAFLALCATETVSMETLL